MLVLIVDDDPDDREALCEAMRLIDPAITCIVQKSGIEALEYLNQHVSAPDYIFLDINMPRMNGKECLASIKETPRFSDIIVIMYSTTELPAEILKYKDMGALFLQKPTSITALVQSLKEILKKY